MKIGLEFEGVITNAEGNPTRWSEIPLSVQAQIKREMGVEADPCDLYDALAEVRTAPLSDPNGPELLWNLFREIEKADAAFESAGFKILWHEMEMPAALHRRLVDEVRARKKKVTYSIEGGRVISWLGNQTGRRGGGMHITVSPVPFVLAPAMALALHERLRHIRRTAGRVDAAFLSDYRTTLLYRTRIEATTAGCWCWEPLAEYMSFGLALDPSRPAMWNMANLTQWAGAVVDTLDAFFRVVGAAHLRNQ